jgi:deoxycytidylate deaminase
MKEIWVPIKDYEGLYEVSNKGNIRDAHGKNLIPNDNGQRLQVTLCKNGMHKEVAIHKIVAETFVPNDDPINKIIINHRDGNYRNNSVDNLEWCTPQHGKDNKIKKVYQFNKYYSLIAQYYSANEASKQTGISLRDILAACNGEIKSAGGYKWSYRVPKEVILMDFTENLASLSKCEQRSVAAIITDYNMNQVYSIGVNGGPAGGIDCLCSLGGKETCIHAETQAIAKCTINDKNKIMFVTLSPCVTCASLIVNSGFNKVYYREDWKDNPGVKLLRASGIIVSKI